ncbi:hypothetical protein D9O50_03765 [Oxalobacteraceae bacterium CAVE-383]|nr:hypothetical protein D9O50_03765 [Oxalobacteraceae bacterium CAVE-383]
MRQLERVRKCRLLATFKTKEEVQRLISNLQIGSLSRASTKAKDEAFVWCARFLSVDTPEEAQLILDAITIPDVELTTVAHGLIMVGRDEIEAALGELAMVNTPIGRGAAYISVLRIKGFKAADDWLRQSELSIADIDSDAKFFYLKSALENGEWASAFDTAKSIAEEDFERSPAILYAAADAYLMQVVPDEMRMFLMQYLPLGASNFPLRSEPESLDYRRIAAKLYERFRSVAYTFGMLGIAGNADDKRLWLQLMDPETGDEARQELAISIKDPAILLRRLNLAIQFNVEIDLLQVEKEVDRQTALSGGTSSDAAVARFALAFAQKNPATAASYIHQHRAQLLKHLEWKGIYFFEIEMLATSSQEAQAQTRLEEAVDRGLTDDETNRLRRLLGEVAGSDPIVERIATYEQSKSIIDLRLVVSAYGEARNWEKSAAYGKLLLDQTGDIADARRYVISLYNQERLDDVIEVFTAYPILTGRYNELRLLYTETLFERGDLEDARLSLNTLRQINDSPDARELQIRLAIASGDWESLQGFVESEWSARAERAPIELIRAGQIAQHIGAVRGKDLVIKAAQSAPDNPTILASCYHAASAAGWESNAEVNQWLERAAELSEKVGDGPIKRVSIEELIEQNPGWEKREAETWNLLAKGDIPIFTAGNVLNRSLLSLFLLPALSNMSEPDVRRRPMVYGFSGVREMHTVDPQIIAMDLTALITAAFLGLLDLYISTFGRIVIPHGTLSWLLEEKARILFHQPSQVKVARDLRQMITERHLHVFDGGVIPPESLVSEVGEQLAALIAEASNKNEDSMSQRLVVRGGPIYKASTFMKEEADLSAYKSYLCSSFDVVDKLEKKALLTKQEAEEARAALTLRERPWPSKLEIVDGAVLYLDDLTVSHFGFLGLLQKLHRADITAIVSRGEMEEADALISYDAKGTDAVNIVERIRICVKGGLESGKVRLGKMIRVADGRGMRDMKTHPTIAMLKLMDEAEAGVSDDRYINQHASISSGTVARPLMTTLDILDTLQRRGAISAPHKQEARTALRRANFVLMPLDHVELSALISVASIADGKLIETAELKAIRENILRIRMSEVLQSPKEITWLNNMLGACLATLKAQWTIGFDEHTAIARSDWLLALGDVKGWAHRLDEDAQQLMTRYRNWLSLLMTLPIIQPEPIKIAYWNWLDSRFLESIEEEDSETYAFLIEHAKALISRVIETLLKR